MGLLNADDLEPKKRKVGGDGTVPRDSEGRPRLLTVCWLCEGSGVRLSPAGNHVKCRGCAGVGSREKTYRRVTSYIDVLEDKSSIQAWCERMVLIGCAIDPAFLRGVLEVEADTTAGRGELNRRAQAAKDVGGANRKSDKGSHLHELSEAIDRGESLPVGIGADDYRDMEAYRLGTHGLFHIRHMEELVVHEDLGVAGTPDRISQWCGPGDLVAPDGTVIDRDELLITDLKTGRVDYGQLKMAMQLAIYSRSDLHIAGSHARAPLGPVNQKWGIIMHLAAGSGVLDLYWADLTAGWAAVELAGLVHEARRNGKAALSLVEFNSASESVSGEDAMVPANAQVRGDEDA